MKKETWRIIACNDCGYWYCTRYWHRSFFETIQDVVWFLNNDIISTRYDDVITLVQI